MNEIRKTKVVCTLGPACNDEATLRALVNTGMDVARFNMSHGSIEDHRVIVKRLRAICEEMDKPVALLLDTKGPEIRTKTFAEDTVFLEEGSEVIIRHDDVEGTAHEFSVTYKRLYEDLKTGDRILLDDGLIELQVESIRNKDIYAVVKNSGVISNHKSVNLPGVATQLPSLTEKDEMDLQFAAEEDFDFVAASFVRRARDVQAIRQVLGSYGATDMLVISKIENAEGLENFNEILNEVDGVMVARGDLGVEIPIQEVPVRQKMMIQKCLQKGKICITATQMLDSMIRNPRPTRAEVSDVANAIMDGTSALMLSGETAAGKYPVQALRTMVDIATSTESHINYWDQFYTQHSSNDMPHTVSNALAFAACTTAMDIGAKAIITVTKEGRSSRLISQHRPGCPIIATTVTERSRRRLKLTWGVTPILMGDTESTDELFSEGMKSAQEAGLVKEGDVVVIVGGTPYGMSGATNTLKVENVGNVLAQGKGVGDRSIVSEVQIIRSSDKPSDIYVEAGTILVAERLSSEHLALVQRASGLIVEDPDDRSYAVMAAGLLDIPLIYACENCTTVLKDGTLVELDPKTGTVR